MNMLFILYKLFVHDLETLMIFSEGQGANLTKLPARTVAVVSI
jgi:hypothetical protein